MMNKIKKEMLKALQGMMGLYFDKVWTESELKISQREVGGKVEVVGPDGELSPAEDGEYVMEDGFAFSVKAGQITSIEGEEPQEEAPEEQPAQEEQPVEAATEEKVPAEEEQPAQEEAPAEEANAEVDALKAKVADLEGVVAALQQAVEELKGTTEVAATKEDVNAFSAQVAELNSTIKQLAKVPVEFSKTNKNNTVQENKDEKLFELAKMIGSVRK